MQTNLVSKLFHLESNQNLQIIQEGKQASYKTSHKIISLCSVQHSNNEKSVKEVKVAEHKSEAEVKVAEDKSEAEVKVAKRKSEAEVKVAKHKSEEEIKVAKPAKDVKLPDWLVKAVTNESTS